MAVTKYKYQQPIQQIIHDLLPTQISSRRGFWQPALFLGSLSDFLTNAWSPDGLTHMVSTFSWRFVAGRD